MRTDGPAAEDRPDSAAAEGHGDRPPAADDTRPVTRDWLRGGPAQAPPGQDQAPRETPGRSSQDGVAPDRADAGTPSDTAAPQRTTKRIDVDPGSLAAPASDDAGADATSVTPPVTATSEPPRAKGSTSAVPEPPTAAEGTRDTAANRTANPPPPSEGGPSDGEPPGGRPTGTWWRRRGVLAVLAVAGALVLLCVLYGVDLLLSRGSIPRSTVVAGIELGGLSEAGASSALEEQLAPRVVADHQVIAADVEGVLSPATAGIMLDLDGTVAAAAQQPLNPWTRLTSFFTDREVAPVITGEETALAAQIETLATQVDRAPVNATIVLEGTTPSLVEPVDGRKLDRDGSAEAITAALASGGSPQTPIELPVVVDPVLVDTEEAQRVLDEVVTPGLSAPVEIANQDGSTSATIPVTAIAAALTFTPQQDGALDVTLDPSTLQTQLDSQLSVFGMPAQDARFELSGSSVTIVPSVDGTGVAPAVLAEQLLSTLTESAPRSVTAELGPVPAAFTTDAANALGVVEEIGSFTTNIGNAASGENIRVVAAEVDGALVLPGETFSLNGFTGPRGTAQGYVEAGVINNGQFTTAVGGGISQFATTMFNAVFFSGLEDGYHKPHSYYISRYPAGREATVYYDSIDLNWRNDSDTGVYIDAQWTPGTITVTFYGTKRYDIESISSDRYNQRSPVVQEKPDDGSCRGQAGSTGFDITVTRVFKDPATSQEVRPREQFQARYAAEPIIRCVPVVGAEPGGPTPPAGTTPD